MPTADTGFCEVADRVWVARHAWFDLNITLVEGTRGLVVVDTHASGAAARTVLDDLARVRPTGRIVAVVNTHEHFDHTFGNATFRAALGNVPIHAHEVAAANTRSAGTRIKAAYAADPDDPHADEVLATDILPATTTFTASATLDLGDRSVRLIHLGRGHTAGDLFAHVPDAHVLVAGDLVEESAPPVSGPDSYPLDWAATLGHARDLLDAGSVVVPGHGAVVDRTFVDAQRRDLGQVADTIRALVADDVGLDDALGHADWPWPRAHLADAVRRGYWQLGHSADTDEHGG